MEIRPIPSAPGYGASHDGRIWRIDPARRNQTMKQEIPYEIKPMTNRKTGYQFFNVYEPKQHVVLVHQSVAEAWHGQRPDNHITAHKNGDKSDNSVNNIYYKPSNHIRMTADIVRHIRSTGMSNMEICTTYGCSNATSWAIRNYRSWKHV